MNCECVRTHTRVNPEIAAIRCHIRRASELVRALDVHGAGSVRFPLSRDGFVGFAEWRDAQGIEWVLATAHQPTHDLDSAAMLLAWMLEDRIQEAA